MKTNWGALGITIGLIFLGVSILAMGFILDKRIAELQGQILSVKADVERTIIAQGYAFSKANSKKSTIMLEDLEEGYKLADRFIGK